ncbi:DUF3375 family protein [bacterium]|nr:DUF3375 family protein [bacterium]
MVSFFSTNPSAKLLSSPHSAYVIFFLHQHFKVNANLATPHAELVGLLAQFLERLHETEPELLQQSAETYLGNWSTGETRWLSRYYDAQHAGSVYQLTPQTEDVLKFLTDVLERTINFVGTESRLTRIIDTLSEIVVRGSDDPQRRLAYLRAERGRIEEEIRSIEAGDTVSTHTPAALRSRFNDIVSDLISLQGDFRAVEERFKEITRDVQRQQTESADSRGAILGFALEAEDRLKEDDQGASFQAFVQLILSQAQQDRLEQMILHLDEITELATLSEGKTHVKRMVRHLSAEAEKVLRTTRRLSATLRRLLDSRASPARLRLAHVLRHISAEAARRAEHPPNISMDVYTELDLFNAWQRSFWEAPVQFAAVEPKTEKPDDDERLMVFHDLAAMQRLDWELMRGHIAAVLQDTFEVTLSQLLEVYPPQGGTIEVLGYIQLAHDQGHEIDPFNTESIVMHDPDNDDASFVCEVPRVVFRRVPSRNAATGRPLT